jgi:hypothetical protein
VAHGARPLTPWRRAPGLGHAKCPLQTAPTAVGPQCYVRDAVGHGGKCIFLQKFVTENIFLQNRDKINIKNYSLLPFSFGPIKPFSQATTVLRCSLNFLSYLRFARLNQPAQFAAQLLSSALERKSGTGPMNSFCQVRIFVSAGLSA